MLAYSRYALPGAPGFASSEQVMQALVRQAGDRGPHVDRQQVDSPQAAQGAGAARAAATRVRQGNLSLVKF